MPDRRESASHLEIKSFGVIEIKDAANGEVGSHVATINVIDKDGDVLLPGSFPASAAVKLSSYAHDVITKGAPPVGKGIVRVNGDGVIFEGKYFMSSERAREAFATVRELGEEGEWSFGFPSGVKTAPMTDEWRSKGARRLIAALQPIEVSPVFIGAGNGTHTLFTKHAKDFESIEALNASADRMFKRRKAR